jgi:hypothetical protein
MNLTGTIPGFLKRAGGRKITMLQDRQYANGFNVWNHILFLFKKVKIFYSSVIRIAFYK